MAGAAGFAGAAGAASAGAASAGAASDGAPSDGAPSAGPPSAGASVGAASTAAAASGAGASFFGWRITRISEVSSLPRPPRSMSLSDLSRSPFTPLTISSSDCFCPAKSPFVSAFSSEESSLTTRYDAPPPFPPRLSPRSPSRPPRPLPRPPSRSSNEKPPPPRPEGPAPFALSLGPTIVLSLRASDAGIHPGTTASTGRQRASECQKPA
jgi:hypothetical protein